MTGETSHDSQKVFLTLVCVLMLCAMFSSPVLAQDQPQPYAYADDLLVSYSEFWYTDGSGTTSHVRYDEPYRRSPIKMGIA